MQKIYIIWFAFIGKSTFGIMVEGSLPIIKVRSSILRYEPLKVVFLFRFENQSHIGSGKESNPIFKACCPQFLVQITRDMEQPYRSSSPSPPAKLNFEGNWKNFHDMIKIFQYIGKYWPNSTILLKNQRNMGKNNEKSII